MADSFSEFVVPDLESYRVFSESNLADDLGRYVVGLQFANAGNFTGSMGSPSSLEGGGAVPEPYTWAMLVLGFGLVGGAMRSAKRRQKLTVS